MEMFKMQACGNWVLIEVEERKTKSGLVVSNLNIGTIISRGKLCNSNFKEWNRVYFNNRNAIEIEQYVLVTEADIYVVIK